MTNRLYGNAVNAPAFIDFVKKCAETDVSIHSFRYLRNGSLAVGADFAPYSGDEKMHVYSLSKSFTSMAVGIAVDEGLLSLDECMCDIFPDKMPASISENLSQMTLRDVITMQSGHEACVFNRVLSSDDSLGAFFSADVKYKPGTKFVYNTAGTMVCGAAVTRRSGESLVDYLDKRLFSRLGIEKPYWERTVDGLCYGGVGLHIDADSIAKFGQMLVDRGVYEGKRIVSAEYIDDASSSHSLDINNGSVDWVSGYGYQLWLNNKNTGGYRGDGAFGQLCIVLPEKREVFVMLCECSNMQSELNVILDFMKNSAAPDNTDFEKAEALTHTAFEVPASKPLKNRIDYVCGKNDSRIFGISLVPDGENMVIELDCDYGRQHIVCGNGKYIHSSSQVIALAPAIVALHKYGGLEPFNVFGAYTIADDEIIATLRHSDLPHTQKWRFGKDKLTITLSCGGLPQAEYDLIKK